VKSHSNTFLEPTSTKLKETTRAFEIVFFFYFHAQPSIIAHKQQCVAMTSTSIRTCACIKITKVVGHCFETKNSFEEPVQ